MYQTRQEHWYLYVTECDSRCDIILRITGHDLWLSAFVRATTTAVPSGDPVWVTFPFHTSLRLIRIDRDLDIFVVAYVIRVSLRIILA